MLTLLVMSVGAEPLSLTFDAPSEALAKRIGDAAMTLSAAKPLWHWRAN